MYGIGICENSKKICADIEECIIKYMKAKGIKAETYVWFSGQALLDYLKRGNSLDLLFLELEQPKGFGIEIAEYIRNELEDYNMQIVYLSEKEEYTRRLFKTHSLDLLVKPIKEEHIISALNLSFKFIKRNTRKFEYQVGTDYYYILYDDIMYFFSEKRKIRIITRNGEESFYGKLSDISEDLPERFIVIHKSYIVNKDYVKHYTYDMLELFNGTVLSISKANRKSVRKELLIR